MDVPLEPVDQPPVNVPYPPPSPTRSSQNPPRSEPVHSPDGTRTAQVVVKRGWKAYSVIVDGQQSANYVMVGRGSPIFSPDSKHVAFTATKGGGEVVVVDGKDGRGYQKVYLPVFSATDGQFAYPAKTRHLTKPWTVVLNEHECGSFESVGIPVFSLDGRHMAFVASTTINHNKWSMVVDGETGEEFDGLLAGAPTFRTDDALEYLAHSGDSLYRIKYILTP